MRMMLTKNDNGPNRLAAVDEIKALTEAGEIEGYASVFGEVDQGGDIVQRGAYAGSLSRLGARGIRPKLLWQHDPGQPIGVWDEIREDERGLWVKGRLLVKDVPKAREAHALLQARAINGLSIGYRTLRADRNAEGNRLLHEVDLWEVSVVTFPMSPESGVTGVKALCDLKTIRDFEEALVNGTLPRLPAKDAKALLAEGFKAMRTERDAGGDGHGVTEALNALAAAFRR